MPYPEERRLTFLVSVYCVLDVDGVVLAINRPLQLIFSPAIVAKYNSLLQFFLRVNRVQWRLQQTWMLGRKNGSAEERSVAGKCENVRRSTYLNVR